MNESKRFVVLPGDPSCIRDFNKGKNYNLQTPEQAETLTSLLTDLYVTGTRYATVINNLLKENEALKEGLENYKVTNNRLIEDLAVLRQKLNLKEQETHTTTSELFIESNLIKSTEDFETFLDMEEEYRNG